MIDNLNDELNLNLDDIYKDLEDISSDININDEIYNEKNKKSLSFSKSYNNNKYNQRNENKKIIEKEYNTSEISLRNPNPYIMRNIFRYKIVRAKSANEIDKSKSMNISIWLVKIDNNFYERNLKISKTTPIYLSIGYQFGIYKESKEVQINEHNKKILPLFEWNDENTYWINDKDIYSHIKDLKILLTSNQIKEFKYSNPGKKKDLIISNTINNKDIMKAFNLSFKRYDDKEKKLITQSIVLNESESIYFLSFLEKAYNEVIKLLMNI